MMKQYSFIRKPYIAIMILACIVIVFSAIIFKSHLSWFMFSYKSIVFLYVISALIIFIEVFLRQAIYYLFAIPNVLWTKELDRPRFLFYCLSIFLVGLSYKGLPTGGAGFYYWTRIATSLISLIMGFFLMKIIWTKMFESVFVSKIKEMLIPISIISCTSSFPEERITSLILELEGKFIAGNTETIYKLLKYNTTLDKIENMEEKNKLDWTCKEGLNNNQIFNSQTLLEFISSLYGTEDSETLTAIIKNLFKKEYHVSSKNISTWKANNSKYLKRFEDEVKILISDSNIS